MAKIKHKEFEAEKIRLKETQAYLERTIATVVDNRKKFKEDIKDAYVNLDYLDSSLSYSSIMLNSKLLDELEKNFELLLHARKKTYFARMDIQQEGKDHIEKLYIGKVSLRDETMETPMVVDWRAPIASVYYDGRLGNVAYQVNDKEFKIDLSKKRQYTIEDGKLIDFMDVDISTTDAFLQASLENHAGEKLKDIVSTIQGEQNDIIRADIDRPLIVQGVAGSGKTTIALHRIAYLIYTYSETFKPYDFMIIAPNNLFLDYISGVLPELGADKVKQTTYIDLMFEWIGKKFKLTDSNKKLNTLIRNDALALSDEEKARIEQASAFKNSMHMKKLLDDYLRALEIAILPEEDYYIGEHRVLGNEEIRRMYYESYNHQPFYRRMDTIKKYLSNFTRNTTKKLVENLSMDYEKRIERIMDTKEPSDERRLEVMGLIEERDQKLEALKKNGRNATNSYMKKVIKNDLLGFYKQFIAEMDQRIVEEDVVDPNLCTYIMDETNRLFAEKKIEVEDLAPMVYLKEQIFGLDDIYEIKYAVIDEAQDFSDFQFHVLRKVLKTDRFTILGDLSQSIHMYRAIKDWDYIKTGIFNKEVNYLSLEQSYRTTIEIMNLANDVLKQLFSEKLIMAKPVVRHGQQPTIKSYESKRNLVQGIVDEINTLTKDGYTTIAIVTKSSEEARLIHMKLIKACDMDIALIDEKVRHFDHRIVVLPAHLAKGLEFDCVIVGILKDKFEKNEIDAKLLYVAMTRALHRLSIYCRKDAIPFVESRPEVIFYERSSHHA